MVELALVVEAVVLGAGGDAAGPVGEDCAVGKAEVGVLELGGEADAVEGLGGLPGYVGELAEGGEEIDGGGDGIECGAGLNLLWVADEEGGAGAAFVGGAFASTHIGVVAPAVGAVVGEVDDDGIFFDIEFLDTVEEAADVGVDVFDHGEGGAGVVGVFVGGVGGEGGEFFVGEAGPVFVGGLHGGVWSGEGEVGEEGCLVGGLLFDEVESGGGEGIGEVAGALDEGAVVVEQGVEVGAPVSGGEAVVFVEAAGVWVVWGLGAVVPFAEGGGGVAGGAEDLGDGFFVGVEAFAAGSGVVDAAAWVVAAGEEFGAGGGADGLDVEVFELGPLLGESVEGGCIEILATVEGEISPALVVGEDDEDVGGISARSGGKRGE